MKSEKFFEVFPRHRITTSEELDKVVANIERKYKQDHLSDQQVERVFEVGPRYGAEDELGAAKGFVAGVLVMAGVAVVCWLAAWWWYGGLAGAVR